MSTYIFLFFICKGLGITKGPNPTTLLDLNLEIDRPNLAFPFLQEDLKGSVEEKCAQLKSLLGGPTGGWTVIVPGPSIAEVVEAECVNHGSLASKSFHTD